MDFDKLPNFLIIGAGKSGTTSLFDILKQHPQVYGPKKKELRFFSYDKHYAKGPQFYEDSYFKKAGGYAIRTEASPAYLNWSEKSAPRIKEVYGDRPIKLLAIFRDPVKRAYSQYWHRWRLGSEDGSYTFAEAVKFEEERIKANFETLYYKGDGLHGYVRCSHFMQRLQPFLDRFPRESFHFMLQQDLYVDFDARMAELCRFLGIDDTFKFSSLASNEAFVPRYSFLGRNDRDLKNKLGKHFFRMFLSKNAKTMFVRDLIMKKFEFPPMDEDVRKALYAEFAEETTQLAKLIGRDLSDWTYKPL